MTERPGALLRGSAIFDRPHLRMRSRVEGHRARGLSRREPWAGQRFARQESCLQRRFSLQTQQTLSRNPPRRSRSCPERPLQGSPPVHEQTARSSMLARTAALLILLTGSALAQDYKPRRPGARPLPQGWLRRVPGAAGRADADRHHGRPQAHAGEDLPREPQWPSRARGGGRLRLLLADQAGRDGPGHEPHGGLHAGPLRHRGQQRDDRKNANFVAMYFAICHGPDVARQAVRDLRGTASSLGYRVAATASRMVELKAPRTSSTGRRRRRWPRLRAPRPPASPGRPAAAEAAPGPALLPPGEIPED